MQESLLLFRPFCVAGEERKKPHSSRIFACATHSAYVILSICALLRLCRSLRLCRPLRLRLSLQVLSSATRALSAIVGLLGSLYDRPLCAPTSCHASSPASLSAVELEPKPTKEALSNDVFSGGEQAELDPREAGAGATSGGRATPNWLLARN